MHGSACSWTLKSPERRVITALRDATQPSNTQGALQRRHLLRKYSVKERKREQERERDRGGGSGCGWRGFGMRFGKFEVNLLNVG